MLVDREHILKSQRLEVEAIACVVVRRHGLWIAIDHYRFVAILAERKRCMAAAVIEFNALPDTVWPASRG